MSKQKDEGQQYQDKALDPKWIEEQSKKHPLTFELITGTAHDLIGLVAVGTSAPQQVQPWLNSAAKGMSELGLFVATALEEADDACITNIENKVRERLAKVSKQVEERPSYTAGHALQQMFGLPNRQRKIGFEYPADVNPPS